MLHFLRTAAILIALSLTGIQATTAFASTVQLIPSASTVTYNEGFTIDVYMDASDAPGNHPSAFQGNFVIDFDPGLATYNSFSFNSPANPLSGTGITVGSQSVTIGFKDAFAGQSSDKGIIGTFNFTAGSDIGSVIEVGIGNAYAISTFANQFPTLKPFSPDFTPTSVEIVPVPAAAWLMLSALGVIGLGAGRRRA